MITLSERIKWMNCVLFHFTTCWMYAVNMGCKCVLEMPFITRIYECICYDLTSCEMNTSDEHNTCQGPIFINPDQDFPWLKDEIGKALLSTTLYLQFWNFVTYRRHVIKSENCWDTDMDRIAFLLILNPCIKLVSAGKSRAWFREYTYVYMMACVPEAGIKCRDK